MKRIFLDIETLPAEENKRGFVENKLRERFLKRSEIPNETEFSRQAEIAFKDTALRGSLGRLLCIGLAVDDGERAFVPCVCGQDSLTQKFHADEARTLQQFWSYLRRINFDCEQDLLVGHNILGFDLPFLYQRSMIYGIQPTRRLLSEKNWECPVFDTMQKWKMGRCADWVSLEELGLAFGLSCPKKGKVNAENLLEAFLAGQHEEIREYCLADVRCVREIYYRMNYQTPPIAKQSVAQNPIQIAPIKL